MEQPRGRTSSPHAKSGALDSFDNLRVSAIVKLEMSADDVDVLVIGGGPAGLRAAELVSAAGRRTALADQMRSVGRKFLVAGRGGLNLTHAEPLETFVSRYGEPRERWESLLRDFSPDDLRAWAKDLGIETFVGTSRRVFPVGKHAAPLLRRWIERLRQQRVSFRPRHRFTAFQRIENGRWEITFEIPEGHSTLRARTVIFALGGGSWPQTGSDGQWTDFFEKSSIPLTPLTPANSGYHVEWPPDFLTQAEGLPLKNVWVRAGDQTTLGELLITHYGLEGGALYQLGRRLRGMPSPELTIDLKPTFSIEQLAARIGKASTNLLEQATHAWRLSPAAESLLRLHEPFVSGLALARLTKSFPLKLRDPRPIAEAISTAGGVAWSGLDEKLMLTNHPGLFCAGEMLDWEAPTGGYLLQGCLATGTRAARGAIAFLDSAKSK